MAPERVTIIIKSSVGPDAPLTVQDAMHQILDFFDLLSSAGGSDAGLVNWRLVRVSMKSPLEATAEAFSNVPGIPPEPVARKEKQLLQASLDELTNKGLVPDWMDSFALARADAFFRRNMNGVGRTDIVFDEQKPLTVIVEKAARAAIRTIEEREEELQPLVLDQSRTEAGSIGGEITDLTTYHHHLAVVVRERLTRLKITCVLSDELAERIGRQHDWSEVWSAKRVVVPGKVIYRKDGSIARVMAQDILSIDSPSLQYQDFVDPNFTNGLSPTEYLERLWEGDVE